MLRSLFTFFLFCCLPLAAIFAQNCPPPVVVQEIYLFPTEANYAFTLSGATGGLAELVREGQPFDSAMTMAIFDNKVYFQFLTPNTTYYWRAQAYCTSGGLSDWTPVYSFTTPALLCPPTVAMPFNTEITLTFPTAINPNIGYSNCGSPTGGTGYVYSYVAPFTGDYVLSVEDASGGNVRMGVSYQETNFCRGSTNCLSPTGEAGLDAYLPAINAGDRLTFVFSAAQGVPATRKVRLRYGPCYPPQLMIDTIKPDSARVYSTAFHVDLELVAETDTFTGIPDYTDVSGFLTFQNLTPGTSYRWRGRTNCGGNVSTWVNGPGFTTPYNCDSIPWLKCDSVYGGFAAGLGRQKMLRYRPERSHDFLFISNLPEDPSNTMTVALRDSALGDCFSRAWQVTSWPTYLCCRSGMMDTLYLGYVEAGKTYYLYANKADTSALTGTLRWVCPSVCPAPGNLHSTVVAADAATLYWENNGATETWEMEVQLAGVPFTGTPQYSGTGDSFTVTQLLLDTLYNWRVRSICAGEGTGEWSNIYNFHTPMDCANAVEVTCAYAVGAMTFPSFSQLNTCPGSSEGTERFFRFTPPYSGDYLFQSFQTQYVGFSFKALTGDCASNTGWTCLGQGSNTWPMGQLTGGQPYLIAVDFPSAVVFPNLQAYFSIVCPIACLGPTDLFNSNLTATSVQLNWTAQPNQVSWEIEIQPLGAAFTGVANYFSNQNNLVISNLLATTAYHWRVQGNCGTLGQSSWSETKNFFTLPDCTAYPLLTCEDEIKLYFPEGEGYWMDLPDCSQHITGREQIVQFTASTMTQYIFLPGLGAYSGFYLKNAASGPCAETTGWQCVGSSDSVLITLPNLTPGTTYYLLCKRRETYGVDSLRLSLHCTPCVAPRDPQTEILYNGTWVVPKWDGGNGPWTYQVALRYPDGSEQLHSGVSWVYGGGYNLREWFTINSSDIHAWRVRAICNNGDTSAWTPYSRFRLPLCGGSEILPCHDTLVSSVGAPDQYFYYNVCNGKTEFGQQRIFRLVAQPGGDFQLRLDLTNNSTVHYALSGNLGSNCAAADWTTCGTFTGDTLLQLNNLGYGNFLLQFNTQSSVPLAPIIETFCPCIAPQAGKGFLYNNGQAVLSWTETYTADQVDIEVVPVGTAFSGLPNYYSDTNSIVIDGLDPTLTYQFRVRNQCGDTQDSGWSPAFSVTLLVDCANMPTLACGANLSLEVTPNVGSFNFQPCGSFTFGDEAFFKITPEFTNTYVLQITSTPHISSVIHLGFLDNCDSPTSTITCIGSGGEGEYNLGYLEAGQTYYIVADQSSFIEGTYQMRLNCQAGNDNPTILLGNPNPAYVIAVGDTCRVFSNQNATANNDPDPSQPPGNWYDATEHSVWFAFVAPPGGTVQITAASHTSQPFDPQVALLVFDTLSGGSFTPFALLATGEDNVGPNPADAVLIYTGLIPGQTYYILVDGVNGSSGRFCLTIRDEPDVWLTTGVCQTFPQPAASFETTGAWRNLYTNDGSHATGALLGAIRTVDDLGAIAVSSEILSETPVLPGGQKLLPRYFNFETEFAPQSPVTLRLFFTAADLAAFNLAPPASSTTPVQLGLTHYDGAQEDCDPTNNTLTGGLAVNTAQAILVGENGLFYLEAVFDNFSEFGAALKPTVGTSPEPNERFAVSAFPNPFDKILQLQVHSPTAANLDFQLFDVLASPVQRGQFAVQTGENAVKLNLPGLTPGIYQLVLYRAGGVVGRMRVVKI